MMLLLFVATRFIACFEGEVVSLLLHNAVAGRYVFKLSDLSRAVEYMLFRSCIMLSLLATCSGVVIHVVPLLLHNAVAVRYLFEHINKWVGLGGPCIGGCKGGSTTGFLPECIKCYEGIVHW